MLSNPLAKERPLQCVQDLAESGVDKVSCEGEVLGDRMHVGWSSILSKSNDWAIGTLDFLRQQVVSAWDWLETTVSDVTDDQANWWPPGSANSIGAT